MPGRRRLIGWIADQVHGVTDDEIAVVEGK
jgi:hypothetical protein